MKAVVVAVNDIDAGIIKIVLKIGAFRRTAGFYLIGTEHRSKRGTPMGLLFAGHFRQFCLPA